MSSERAKISPDLVQQLFKLWFDTNQRTLAAEAEAARAVGEVPDVDADASKKNARFAMKDEAAMAAAEIVRQFVSEITGRAAEAAIIDGDAVLDGTHLERVLPQLLLDFAT